MKQFYSLALLLLLIGMANAQNVGVGTNNPASKLDVKGNLTIGNSYSGTTAPANGAIIEGQLGVGTASPDSKALLDLTATDKGVLLPRVALVSTTNPISGAKPDGLMVYNTSTSGTYPTPGVYVWSTTTGDWVRIITNSTLSGSLQPLSNSAGGGLGTFSYNGGTATQIGIANQGVVTGMLANDAVTTTQIAPNTITSADMGPNSVDLSSGVVTNVLPVNRGGTNTNSLGSGGSIAYSNGTSYSFSPVGTTGQVLLSGGTGQPTWGQVANAQLANSSVTINAGTGLSGGGTVALGSSVTLNNAGVTSLSGTPNQVSVSASVGAVTLSTPQNIHSGASPTFAGLNLSGLTTNAAVYTDGAKNLTTTAPASGSLGYWTRSGTNLYNTTLTDNLGVGVTAPTAKLHVGAGEGDGITIGNPNDAMGLDGGSYAIKFYGYRDVIPNAISAKITAERTNVCCSWLSQGTDLAFYTNAGLTAANADNSVERMRIKDNGNVIISSLGSGLVKASGGTLQIAGAGDLPAGNGNYIQNQYGGAQSANFWVSGEGRVGSWFRNSSAGTGLYNEATTAGIYSPSSGLMSTYNGSNFRIEGNRLYGSGSSSNYGALTIQGDKNGWGGISFRDAAGNLQKTLMITSVNSGIYNSSDNNWDWLYSGGALQTLNGYSPANNVMRLTPNLHLNANGGYAVILNWDNGAVSAGTQQLRIGNGQSADVFGVLANGDVTIQNKLALRGDDSWLRLNQNANFSSGTYTPGFFRADQGLATAGLANAYGGVYGVNSPYYHTNTNDSWFPYPGNNYNYIRGNAYAWNAHWYDENNAGYYMNPDNTNRLAYLYYGIGAYNVGGWMSGITQTENTSDGHQYVPLTGNWGYVGTSGQYWYYMYSNNYVDVSQRETKRNITPLDKSAYDYVMEDIDKMKPSFYKYKLETDDMEPGNEPKYRPNMHIGLILDEAPDYIQDQAFSGVDIYALASLSLAGVKHNREDIKELKTAVASASQKISDFGNEAMSGNEVWVPFSAEFKAQNKAGVTPVVTVSANQTGVVLSVTETTAEGFKVTSSTNTSGSTFNWIAMAKVPAAQPAAEEKGSIAPELLSQLKVDESKKAAIRTYWQQQKEHNQAEAARQKAEHERIVQIGESQRTATQNVPAEPGNK